MLLGLLQVLVLLLLLEEYRWYLGLQDPDFSMLEVWTAAGAVPRVSDSSSLLRECRVWVLWWGPTGLRALLAASQLWEAVRGAHVAGDSSTVPLQGQLQEPFTQRAHMPMPQLPQGLVLPAAASWGPTRIPIRDVWPRSRLLGCIVLGVGFGLLIGRQLLALAGLWAQPVQVVLCQVSLATLVLLALGLLPGGLLQHLTVLRCQDLQGGLGTPRAPSSSPTPKGLLLYGQQGTCLCQVAITQLLLDEAVQDCP